jgi:glycerophosphoryl diester phosphodiesterase
MPEPLRTHRPLLLGHRGARAFKPLPENTLASFDRALADGCDGFEFDVRLTADNVAVVCHDPKTEDAEIASATVAQLSNLPRLEDVLARYKNSAFLDIELKVQGLEEVFPSGSIASVTSARLHSPYRLDLRDAQRAPCLETTPAPIRDS